MRNKQQPPRNKKERTTARTSLSRNGKMKTFILIAVCWWLLWFGFKIYENEPRQQLYIEAMKQRERCGLSRQVLDKQLCEQADRWAQHMASTGRFGHGGGEQIIAMGYRTPRQAINGWMRSEGHRRWMMCNRSHVGFGFATSKSGHPYYVGIYRNKK